MTIVQVVAVQVPAHSDGAGGAQAGADGRSGGGGGGGGMAMKPQKAPKPMTMMVCVRSLTSGGSTTTQHAVRHWPTDSVTTVHVRLC